MKVEEKMREDLSRGQTDLEFILGVRPIFYSRGQTDLEFSPQEILTRSDPEARDPEARTVEGSILSGLRRNDLKDDNSKTSAVE